MSNCATFIKNLFEIGDSAGSLLSEAITLFKTFQRINAPKVFATKLSPECIKMFNWVSKITNYITSALGTYPLTNFESFIIYSYIFPITIITFISCSTIESVFLLLLLFIGTCFVLGMGVTDFAETKVFSTYFMIGGGAFVFVVLLALYFGCCKGIFSKKKDKGNGSIFLLSFCASICFFYSLISMITIKRWKFAKILSIILGSLELLVIIIYFISKCFHFEKVLDKLQQKISGFFITCLPLLIIPSTEIFSELNQGYYSNKWQIITSYAINTVIIPISIIISMIILRHPNISDKYKNSNSKIPYGIFELIDNIKQVGYAFLAVYDIIWGCLAIEIVWIILIFAVRPYISISEYSLSGGNSLIIIISNSVILYMNNHKSKKLSFGISVFFLVLTCIPAILSLYLYFIFDYENEDDDDDSSLSSDSDSDSEDEDSKNGTKLALITIFMLPVLCFCFGLNINFLVLGDHGNNE